MQHPEVGIETDRREKGNAGRLELPPLAKDVLAKARQHRSYDGGYVFPGRHGQIYNNVAGGKLVLEKMMDGELFGIAPWTLHDLRRTFSTGIAKLGVMPHIKEMILAHSTAKDSPHAALCWSNAASSKIT